MSLTAIVATIGRPSLERTITSVEHALPGAQVLVMPSPASAEAVGRRFPQLTVGTPTEGLYEAWNVAVQRIETTHCVFVNDDDYLEGAPLDVSSTAALDRNELIVLPFVREGRRRTPPSLTRIVRAPSPLLIDLLRATRLMINTVIWPRTIFDEVGVFSEDYRVRGDAEWMCRLSKHRVRFIWASAPRYVQNRAADRLSSAAGPNRDLLFDEAVRLADELTSRPGSTRTNAMVMKAWLWNLRRTVGARDGASAAGDIRFGR